MRAVQVLLRSTLWPALSRLAKSGRERAEQLRSATQLQDGRESAEYHPLAVEWHRILLRTQPRITHDLRHRGVSRCLVRPLDPRKHHHLIILGLHGTAKIGQLAVFDIIAPALEDALRAILDEYRIALLGMIDESLLVSLGHCNHEAVDVAHFPAPVDRAYLEVLRVDVVVVVKFHAQRYAGRSCTS